MHDHSVHLHTCNIVTDTSCAGYRWLKRWTMNTHRIYWSLWNIIVFSSNRTDEFSCLYPSAPPVSVPQMPRTGSSRFLHCFKTIIDARCVRDLEGSTIRWLIACHWLRVRVSVRKTSYVVTNHEKEMRFPPWWKYITICQNAKKRSINCRERQAPWARTFDEMSRRGNKTLTSSPDKTWRHVYTVLGREEKRVRYVTTDLSY